MELVYLGAILAFRVVQKTASKATSLEMPHTATGMSLFMSVKMGMSAAAALSMLLLSGSAGESLAALPPLGWVISCATGLTLSVSTICSLLALRGSSITLGALFSMAGLLIPMISGIFLYDQPVSLFQWGGVVALLAAAWLLAAASQQTNGRLTLRTLVLLVGSMTANGCTMLLQTLYKAYVPEGSVSLYSFLQFAIPAVLMLLFFLGSAGETQKSFKFSKKLLFATAASAVALFGISQTATVASETVPIAVLFPVSDGGGAVIAAIVAAVVYHEKLTVKSGLGILVGIVGVCIMKLGG